MAARVRVGGFRLSSTVPRVRVGGFRLQGTISTAPRVRVGGFRLHGAAASSITPADVLAMPSDEVDLTIVLGSGQALPDSVTWAVSGAGGAITPTGLLTATFLTPSVFPPQADSVITATPMVGSVAQRDIVALVHTLPQTIWVRNPGSSTFIGAAAQPDS